ncbi:hypothetical protein SeMB42_g04879 [Synchytrium endobioticum]|uniref:Uncharacterized protein n=1 Tax=Synchytrium endobioticum TaxID=286115 RepID=A0A507CX61_9FUNG|nr:hypothetical protein SeMB42_g04879 [Synchytrium endobioticum]TPX43450.1 hypothetical protein SeLEV6574_g05048 [Synchytrium endobioticum]
MSSRTHKRAALAALLLDSQNGLDTELDVRETPRSPSLPPSTTSSTASSWSITSIFTRAGQYIGILPKSLETPMVAGSEDRSDVVDNMMEHHGGQPIVKRKLSKMDGAGRSFLRLGSRSRKHKRLVLSEQDTNKLYTGQHAQHANDPSLNHLLDEYGGNPEETERILHELNNFYAQSGIQDHEELLVMLIQYAQNAKSSGGASSQTLRQREPRKHEGVDEEREKRIAKEMYGRFLATGVEVDSVIDVLMKEAAKLQRQKANAIPRSKL